MIFTTLDDPQLSTILPGPVWSEALDWIREKAHSADLGIHPIRGEQMFVNVQAYDTKAREECRFESHRSYVDLQYTIEGVEGIDYHPTNQLTREGDFNAEKDVQWFNGSPEGYLTLPVTGNNFAVFFPQDAHRPKVAIDKSTSIRKLVVKVDLELLG